MLNLFRKNHFLNSLLILPYALILRMPLLFGATAVKGEDHPLLNWLSLETMPLFWHWIIGSLLIFLQVTILNRMIIRNRIMRDPSLIGGLGYLMLSCLFRDMTYVSADLIAMSFFIPALSYLFDIYKKFHVELDLFNAGLLTGMAALINPAFLFFTITGFTAILKLRAFRTREFLQYFNAIILPFFLFWAIAYLTEDTASFFVVFEKAGWSLAHFRDLWNMHFFRWSILLIGLAMALFSFNSHMVKKSIQAQKKIEVLYWILGLSLPVALTGTYLSDQDFLIFFLPVGILLGMILHRTPNRPLAEVIHFLLFFGSLANQYYLWW